MTMPSISPERPVRRAFLRLTSAVLGVAVLGSVVFGVMLSPMVIVAIYGGDRDWSRLGDIGQTYGPASALLSALALALVVILQRGQVRHERTWMLRELHASVVKIALGDPRYVQCWGQRVAPPEIDERLFYYVNLIISMWSYAWEQGQLRDEHIRSYAAGLFMAAVPREYWRWHGDWRASGERGRKRRFMRILAEEYRRAVDAGPPPRPFEEISANGDPALQVDTFVRRSVARRNATRRVVRKQPVG